MRVFLLSLVFPVLLSVGCGNDSAAGRDHTANGKTTTVLWIDSSKNFGKINEGQKLAISFRFKNTGVNPLVIESVRPACGCTVADFPKEPIAPGEENQITGEFDSHGREGLQHKTIVVKANTPGSGEQEVNFEVDVVKKPEAGNSN